VGERKNLWEESEKTCGRLRANTQPLRIRLPPPLADTVSAWAQRQCRHYIEVVCGVCGGVRIRLHISHPSQLTLSIHMFLSRIEYTHVLHNTG